MQSGSALRWHWQRFGGELGLPRREIAETRTRASSGEGREPLHAWADETAPDAARKPLRVYIVEDSSIARKLLTGEIERAGAQLIGSSPDAGAAIGDVFALQPDLILIDIRLASGSGFDVLKALQMHSLAPAALKVVLTNYANPEYRDRSVRLGADRFFDKSFETAEALELIDTVAAEGRSRVSPLL
jgi:CheY-like chemotaxis protein